MLLYVFEGWNRNKVARVEIDKITRSGGDLPRATSTPLPGDNCNPCPVCRPRTCCLKKDLKIVAMQNTSPALAIDCTRKHMRLLVLKKKERAEEGR
jgi:hypothetical protein